MQKTFENDFQVRLIIAEEGLLIANKEGLSLIPRTQIGEGLRCSRGSLRIRSGQRLVRFAYRRRNRGNCFGPSAAPCWLSSSVCL